MVEYATTLCGTCGNLSMGFGMTREAAQNEADAAFFHHAKKHHEEVESGTPAS